MSFSKLIHKVKVEDLTPERNRMLEFLWSLFYSLIDTFWQIVACIFYLFLFVFIYHFSNNFQASLMIIFFSLLGGNQFSQQNIEQVEKKVGYKIF